MVECGEDLCMQCPTMNILFGGIFDHAGPFLENAILASDVQLCSHYCQVTACGGCFDPFGYSVNFGTWQYCQSQAACWQ